MIRTLRLVFRHGSFISIAGGAVIVAQVWPLHEGSPRTALIGGALVVGGAAAVWIGWRRHDILPNPVHLPCAIDVVQGSYSGLTPVELQDAARLLGKMGDYCERVNHRVQPVGNYLVNEVARVVNLERLHGFRTAQKYDGRLIVPIVHPARGHLIDNLDVATPPDTSTHICPSAFAASITYQALCVMTIDAYQRADAEMLRVLASLREAIVADQTMVFDRATLARFASSLDELAALAPAPGALENQWTLRLAELIRLWSAAMSSYAVLAIVEFKDSRSRLEIKVSYSVPVTEVSGEEPPADGVGDAELNDAGRNSWKTRLRGWLGVQPWIYRFPLNYERAANSYNLQFVVPDDQYVYSLSVRRRDHSDQNPSPAHLGATRDGDSHAMPFVHLYLRPLAGVHPRGELRARVAVLEKPPGILGLVAMIGLAQLVLVGAVLAAASHVFRDEAGADMAAVLLVVPSVVYMWIGSQLGPGRLRRVPLAAVGGMALNGALSIIAAILALFAANDIDPWAFTVGSIDVTHTLWLILFGVSAWGVGNQVMRWYKNTRTFVLRESKVGRVIRFTV